MASERVEAVLESLTYTRGVLGVVVCLADGTPIRDTFQNLDRSIAVGYCRMASELARTATLVTTGSLAKLAESTPAHAGATSGNRENSNGRRESDGLAERGPLLHQSELELLRVRTRNNEVIVQCCEEFLLVVVQEPVDA